MNAADLGPFPARSRSPCHPRRTTASGWLQPFGRRGGVAGIGHEQPVMAFSKFAPNRSFRFIAVELWPPRTPLYHTPAGCHWASSLAGLALAKIRTLEDFVASSANGTSYAERGSIRAGSASHQRNCTGSRPPAIIRGQNASPDEFVDADCPRASGSNPTLPNFRSAK